MTSKRMSLSREHCAGAWRVFSLVWVRFVLPCMLSLGAFSKATALGNGTWRVFNAGPAFKSFWWILITIEFLFAIALSGGIRGRWIQLSGACLFGSFVCYLVYTIVHGSDTCGCFGTVGVRPIAMLTVDCVSIPAIWSATRLRVSIDRARPVMRIAAFRMMATIIIGLICARAVERYDYGPAASTLDLTHAYVSVDPVTWIGKPLPVSREIDIGSALNKGEWQVVFYHHDCDHCRRFIASLANDSHRINRHSRLALVEVPPYGSGTEITSMGIPIPLHGHLDSRWTWFIRTPVVVRLVEGRVMSTNIEY